MARGEPGIGKWSVVVKDAVVNDFNGTFTDWRLTLWGESIDASKQELHPMPKEGDDDHDVISAVVSTASGSPGAVETGLSANPTDHIDRPVKPTVDANPSTTSVVLLPTVAIPPYITPTSTTTATPSASSSSADTFLPHYFPTFGVSKRTQIWIYGALAIIILFCAGLAMYFYVQRRKRLRNSRDVYEFDVLADDDNDTRAGIKGVPTKGRRANKRGGELYDAFAGESDEDLLSDDEEAYKDADEDDDGAKEERGRSQSREFDEKGNARR